MKTGQQHAPAQVDPASLRTDVSGQTLAVAHVHDASLGHGHGPCPGLPGIERVHSSAIEGEIRGGFGFDAACGEQHCQQQHNSRDPVD